MTNKTRLHALVCILASGVAFYGCDDGDSVGSTHNYIDKTAECMSNADCADKGDKTECSSDGVCVAPTATPECTTNDNCADKGDRTECSADGVCVVPAVTPECTTNDDCADKGDKTECNDAGICVVPAVCDNGTLEDGEECDGLLVAENLDLDCGDNKQLVDTPICIAGICKIDLTQSCVEIQKECEIDDDCADKEEGKTKCDVDNGVCVVPPECEVDDDCADKEEGKTKCDIDNGICIVPPECESHDDCAGKEDGRTRCDVTQNTCYAPECEADDACVDHAEGKTKCDIENGVCVVPPECVVDDDCANKEDNKNVCNTTKGICVQCTEDVHCANCADNKTQCNVAEGICVEPTVVVEPEKPITYTACNYPDEDKDGISDEIEGKAENLDSDGDGIPDYQDLDSDGDTIPDSIEGGTHGCSSALPIDSDRDSTPDYLDTDSDNNGVLDADECCGTDETCKNAKDTNGLFTACLDTDNDSYSDYADSDNDGDYISDLVEIVGMVNPKDTTLAADEFSGDCDKDGKPDKKGNVANPIDCDGDNIPDYMDTDSDGDYISDTDEGQGVYTGGRYYSHYMTDSDGDGISDTLECMGYIAGAKECGGTVNSPVPTGLLEYCADTNKNGIPDYLDDDSDSDGISDAVECHLKSNPTVEDSDGDKTADNIEYSICLSNGAKCDDVTTDAGKAACVCDAIQDPKDDPVTRGDFVFTVPYLKETTPEKQTLSLDTAIQTIDIFFAFDQSGSMKQEVFSLKDSLDSTLKLLKCKEFGETSQSCAADTDCSALGDYVCSENQKCILKCDENSDCKAFENSICSENKRCILRPSAKEDYDKTCTKNDDCSSYPNAFCNSETGKCALDGCFDDMWTGLGFYHRSNSFWVTQHLSQGSDSTIAKLRKMFTKQDDQSTFRTNGDAESPYSAALCAVLGPDKDSSLCYQRSDYTNDCANNIPDTYKSCDMNCSPDSSRIGCVGYRKGAIRIFAEAFDEYQCYYSGSSWSDTQAHCNVFKENAGAELLKEKIRYIGLYNGTAAKNVAIKIGQDSHSTKPDNTTTFSYNAVDADLTNKAAQGIREIARNMPMNITSSVEDIDVQASELVAKLEVNYLGVDEAQGRMCAPIPVESINKTIADREGVNNMLPGVVLCFDVIPVQKQSIFPPDKKIPIVKKARVKVIGDESVLNSGVAYFLIPPELDKQ